MKEFLIKEENVSVVLKEYVSLYTNDAGQLLFCIKQNDNTVERIVTMYETMYEGQERRNKKMALLDNNENVYVGFSYETFGLELYTQDEITTLPNIVE
jgi:hypothetical protein